MHICPSLLATLCFALPMAVSANNCSSDKKILDYIQYNQTLNQLEEVVKAYYSKEPQRYCSWTAQRDNFIQKNKILDIGFSEKISQCGATKKLVDLYFKEYNSNLFWCQSQACDTAKEKLNALDFLFANNQEYAYIEKGIQFQLNRLSRYPELTHIQYKKNAWDGTCGDIRATFLYQGHLPADKQSLINTSIDQHTFPEIKPIKYQPDQAEALFNKLFSQHEYSYIYEEKPEYINDQYFCYSQTFYHYTGGAHGNSNIIYLTLDQKTGQKLKLDQVLDIKHKKAILRLAKINLFSKYNLDNKKSLNENGFWFGENDAPESAQSWVDTDGFYLPDNFLIQDDGLVFLYQPYEITAYAMGAPTINLYWNELDDL